MSGTTGSPSYSADENAAPPPRELLPKDKPIHWEKIIGICTLASLIIGIVYALGWALVDYTQFRTQFANIQADVKDVKERVEKFFKSDTTTSNRIDKLEQNVSRNPRLPPKK